MSLFSYGIFVAGLQRAPDETDNHALCELVLRTHIEYDVTQSEEKISHP